jgi:hypothetical protein
MILLTFTSLEMHSTCRCLINLFSFDHVWYGLETSRDSVIVGLI